LTGPGMASGGCTQWTSSASEAYGTPDTTLCRSAAGVMQVGTTAANSSGAILASVRTASKTANYTIVAGDSGSYFDNSGSTGEVDFTLPAYAAGLQYCFTVTAAQILKVIAPA